MATKHMKHKTQKKRAPTHARRKSAPTARSAPRGREGGKEACGILSGTRRGFAFVTVDALGEDVFIPAERTGGALHGDTVRIVYRAKHPTGIEGRVTEIVLRAPTELVGTLIAERVRGTRSNRVRYFFVPDSSHYPEYIPFEGRPDAKEGDRVFVRLERGRETRAVFLRSFGPASSFGASREALLAEFAIRVPFEEAALHEAQDKASLPVSEEGRTVVRDAFTIDGADAKDLDDAVSLVRDGRGYLLSVHIADVSEYVTPRTPLDRAAMSRGTSVYFADSVVPMLPPALSNGACSLHPGDGKYTLSAHMRLSENGELLSYRVERTLLYSAVRGVYSEVNDIFDKGAASEYYEKYSKVYNSLILMRELYEKLLVRAEARGYFDIEAPEPCFVLGERGEVKAILPRTRGVAERLIEQFMLTANEAVARLLCEKECPGVFRVHGEPPADKLLLFRRYLGALGLDASPLSAVPLSSRHFARVLEEAREKGLEGAVRIPLLRAMAKAVYSDACEGHFGLSLSHYAHFTSPIRRLSDLATHRIIKAVLLDGEDGKKYASYARRAAAAATEAELRAVSAERAMTALYTALWAEDHIGEEVTGVISGITSFGVFVTLENTAEGLITKEELPFGAFTDEERGILVTGKETLHLADRVRVSILDASISARRIRFSFLDAITEDMPT